MSETGSCREEADKYLHLFPSEGEISDIHAFSFSQKNFRGENRSTHFVKEKYL